MAKETQLTVRITPAERRALKRYAKAQGRSVAELVRANVIEPANQFDPRQAMLPLGGKERHPHASAA